MQRLKKKNINTENYWNTKGRDRKYRERAFTSVQRRLEYFLPRINSNANILDIGCGAAPLFRAMYLSEMPIDRYCGVDFSQELIDQNRNEFCDVDWTKASCYNLPFRDNCFNTAIMMEVLEHLEKPILALCEVKRILSGQFLLSVPNNLAIQHEEHVWSFNREDIALILRLTGFRDIKTYIINDGKLIFSTSNS